MFKQIRSRTEEEAMTEAKRLCRCNRASFEGIKWTDMTRETHRVTWKEVDQWKSPE